MAHVVLLRGVNVGGHRTFRPAAFVKDLAHLDAVNIGAAGTFVVRKKVAVAALRDEFARRLPFETEIVICRGIDVATLAVGSVFDGHPVRPEIVRFVSVLASKPRQTPTLPVVFPERGQWLLKIVSRDDRFVFGMYRRHMKVIGYLVQLDKVFGVPATTRNWNTINAIAKLLQGRAKGSLATHPAR